MSHFDELLDWVGFGAADALVLAELSDDIVPHIPAVIDRFYEEVQRHPGSASVLEGPDQVERLKATLRAWLREVFCGPHDAAYANRRQAIGRRHVKVGLPDRYMFAAMHVVEAELVDRLEAMGRAAAGRSLRKILMVDLALMTGTYVTGREEQQLDTLQNLLVTHLRSQVLLIDSDGVVRAGTPHRSGTGLGRPWIHALPPGLAEAGGLERMARAARSGAVEKRVDVNQRSYRVHMVPIHHELAEIIIQIEETTDVVSMEARVRRSEALAQLGTLSAAVAHELRNPLAGISGAIQVLARPLPEDSDERRILGKVDSEIKRLNTLVTDLLAFARQERVSLETVNLGQMARETAEMTQFPVEVVGEADVVADSNLVRQILYNLLRNAIDAAGPEGRVLVEVLADGIRVSDSGAGIDPERAKEIFEPFVTTKTRGTGLGLAICRRAASAMLADLFVANGPLSGASFQLHFRS